MSEEPSSPHSGTFTIEVDGAWDIEDLLALAEAFAESYGYFYALVATNEEVSKRIHQAIQRRFWSGDLDSRRFGKFLYGMIPESDSLKLRSFSYASPGAMTLIGILSALWMAARVARSWAAAGTDILDLWAKVEKFFKDRRKLVKPGKAFELNAAVAEDLDEARVLVFSIGEALGFDALSITRLIDIAGNPITALKYLVALANEARKLTDLEASGLLKLPVPPAGALALGLPPQKGMRGGVVVEKKKRRRPAKK